MKSVKYAHCLCTSMLFVQIAIESFGAFGEEAAEFMSELGRRLKLMTDDVSLRHVTLFLISTGRTEKGCIMT